MNHILRFVDNHRGLSEVFAFVVSFLWVSGSFATFFRNIETLNTSKEWKFYFSLIAFLLFYAMFVWVFTTIVVRRYNKKKGRKQSDFLEHI